MPLATILQNLVVRPAGPDAHGSIRRFEARTKHRLPADLVEFYERCHDAHFAGRRYHLLALDDVRSIGDAQCGDSTDDFLPRSWLAFIDAFDGNFLAADLSSSPGYRWLDCDHEEIGTPWIIASSLAEVVQRASACDGPFYLQPDFVPLGRLSYENPPSYHRRVDGDWWRGLGEESGPETCTADGCARLRIALSVKCRRHHYEMVRGVACPFD